MEDWTPPSDAIVEEKTGWTPPSDAILDSGEKKKLSSPVSSIGESASFQEEIPKGGIGAPLKATQDQSVSAAPSTSETIKPVGGYEYSWNKKPENKSLEDYRKEYKEKKESGTATVGDYIKDASFAVAKHIGEFAEEGVSGVLEGAKTAEKGLKMQGIIQPTAEDLQQITKEYPDNIALRGFAKTLAGTGEAAFTAAMHMTPAGIGITEATKGIEATVPGADKVSQWLFAPVSSITQKVTGEELTGTTKDLAQIGDFIGAILAFKGAEAGGKKIYEKYVAGEPLTASEMNEVGKSVFETIKDNPDEVQRISSEKDLQVKDPQVIADQQGFKPVEGIKTGEQLDAEAKQSSEAVGETKVEPKTTDVKDNPLVVASETTLAEGKPQEVVAKEKIKVEGPSKEGVSTIENKVESEVKSELKQPTSKDKFLPLSFEEKRAIKVGDEVYFKTKRGVSAERIKEVIKQPSGDRRVMFEGRDGFTPNINDLVKKQESEKPATPKAEVKTEGTTKTETKNDKEKSLQKGQEESSKEITAKKGGEEKVTPLSKPFKTSDKKYTVEKTAEGLKVTGKKGKKISTPTQDKAIKEYEDSVDYSKGEKAEDIATKEKIEFKAPEEVVKHIAEKSRNPLEIIQAHESLGEFESHKSYIDQIIDDYATKIDPKSYAMFGDQNNVGQSMAKRFFKKGGRKIDILAQEISDVAGKEVTPKDIVNFVENDKYEKKISPDKQALRDRFKEVTGLTLNDRIIEKAQKQYLDKNLKDHERYIETDSKTREESDKGYYEAIKRGDIPLDEPTESIPDIRDRKSKEGESSGEGKIEDSLRTIAEQLRKGKIDDDIAMSSVPFAKQVWNGAIEAAAKALEAGADITEAIKRAIEFIQKTSWYKNLKDEDKVKAEKKIASHLDKELEESYLKKSESVGLNPNKINESAKVLKKKLTEEARGFIRKRRASIDSENFKTSLYAHGLEKTLSEKQREVIPFIIEGTGIPEKLNRPDLEKIYAEQKNQLTSVADKVKEHFDEVWKRIVENTDNLSSEQIKDYVTHIWDIPKSKVDAVSSWFSTKNRFLNKRYIATLEEGINLFGLKPKVLDIAQIIKIHDSVANTVIANSELVKDFKSLEREGIPLMLRSDKAPDGWVTIDHPALTSPAFIEGKEGNASSIARLPYKVHPDLEKPLKAIFDKKFDHPAFKAWELLNSVMRKISLSVSLFHHGALTETALPNMGVYKTGKTILKDVIYKAMRDKANYSPLLDYPEEAIDAITHGVKFGHTLDIDVGEIKTMMGKIAKGTENIPLLNRATRFLDSLNDKWDNILWNYLHDGLKLQAFMDAKSKSIGKKNAEVYLQERAQLINDYFGGQNWDNLLVSPKTQQLMSSFLLSPDWTTSKLRLAGAPIGLGKISKDGAFDRAKASGMFWVKSAIYYGIGINLLNAYYRNEDEKEHPEYYPKGGTDFWDKTMFHNTIGHKTHLFTGRYEDGSEKYLRWGKEFREVPELFMDEDGVSFPKPALRKMGGKMSPMIQISSQLFTGNSASGYENWDLKNKRGWDWTLGAMKLIGKSFVPFSSGNFFRDDKEWQPSDLMFPSSKGMSGSSAMKLFKKGIDSGDEAYVKEVYENAVRNGLDAYDLFKTALQTIKSENTKELTADLKTVEDVERELKNATGEDKVKLRHRLTKIKLQQKNKVKSAHLMKDALKKLQAYEDHSKK